MASFQIWLSGLHISNTRSRHTDSDYAFLSVTVGTQTLPLMAQNLGDLNNGDFSPAVKVETGDIPDDGTPVTINWSVINSGAGPSQAYKQALDTAGPTAITEVNGGDDIYSSIAITIFNLGTNLFFPNCDGFVVKQSWSGTAHDLYVQTSSQNPWQIDRWDNGTDSPSGCGSNSAYLSGIRVTRH